MLESLRWFRCPRVPCHSRMSKTNAANLNLNCRPIAPWSKDGGRAVGNLSCRVADRSTNGIIMLTEYQCWNAENPMVTHQSPQPRRWPLHLQLKCRNRWTFPTYQRNAFHFPTLDLVWNAIVANGQSECHVLIRYQRSIGHREFSSR